MRSALAPVLFDDHDREAGKQQRSSVVQPAQRSPAAQQKAVSKRTADDLPVHSFRSLMSELGTLTATPCGWWRVVAPSPCTANRRRCSRAATIFW